MGRPPFGFGDERRGSRGRARGFSELVRELGRAVSRRLTRRGLAIGAGALLASILLASWAFGPVVRSRVAREAEKRNLEVEVGRVRPGLFAIELGDVHVRIRGFDGLDATLSDVRVDLTAGLAVQSISVVGGELALSGEPDDLAEALRALRPSHGSDPPSGVRRAVDATAENLAVHWKLPAGLDLRAKGVRAKRTSDGIHASVGQLSAVRASDALHVVDAALDLTSDARWRALRVASVAYEQTSSSGRAAPPAESPASSGEPAPPPAVVAVDDVGAGKAEKAGTTPKTEKAAVRPRANETPRVSVAGAAAKSSDDDTLLSLPDLHALRARLSKIIQALAGRVPEGARVEISGLSAKLDVAGEVVQLGPAPLSLVRDGELFRISFKSDDLSSSSVATPEPTKAKGKETPLSVEATLPIGPGDMIARLSGGPVSLAALGVKEGTKGLFDVARASLEGRGTLSLSGAGDALSLDGRIALHGVSVRHPRLSPESLKGIELSLAGHGLLDDTGHLRLDDAEFTMGAVHARAHGTIDETREHLAMALAFEVAPASCQALVDSAPRGLLPLVQSARVDGTFGATGRIAFDTREVDKLVLDYTIDDRCRMAEVPPALARERFLAAFDHRVYHPDGTPWDISTGPGSPDWTPLGDMSPFIVAAVLTTEDGAFYKHHGFNHGAIRSSIAANIKARRFVRGASTITMQLAKNLFLSREKTLSRKIEEVILTDYLEQIFSKDEMMELYLNVVEFGPDVYGITQAADYYFGRKPADLDVAESFFLAMLLPAPLRYGKLHDKPEAPESWLRHLQALLRIAAKNGKLAEPELAAGLNERIYFWHPGEPKPTSRIVPREPRKDPYESDAEWQPVP